MAGAGHGDAVGFTYQYAYLYLLGKYCHTFRARSDVGDHLKYCMQHLYVRECANTLLFLAHHSTDAWVLEQIMDVLKKSFDAYVPVTLHRDDSRHVSALMESAPQLIFRAKDPEAHRTEVNKIRDEHGEEDDGLAESPAPPEKPRDLVSEIVSVSKTMEIVGALVTNNYANLSRVQKNTAISAIFEAGLRMLRALFSTFEVEPERLVRDIAKTLREKGVATTADAEISARGLIAQLLKLLTTGVVARCGMHVNADQLAENIEAVARGSATLATKAIQLAVLLDGPGRLPRMQLGQLLATEADNPCLMSVLQMLVLRRLYMYETEHEDKHWALEVFQLRPQQTSIGLSTKKDGRGAPQLR